MAQHDTKHNSNSDDRTDSMRGNAIAVAAAVVTAVAAVAASAEGPAADGSYYKDLENPFRINRVNLLWNKARPKLSEGKLKALHSRLALHEKEEFALKKLKAEHGDKDGMREAQVRKLFVGIMNEFGVTGQNSEDAAARSGGGGDEGTAKALFKDKKLERLWDKALKAGLTEEEAKALKQEFLHHQEKVDEYHRLSALREQGSNDIGWEGEDQDGTELDGRARDIGVSYSRLHMMATNERPREFESEKAAGKLCGVAYDTYLL